MYSKLKADVFGGITIPIGLAKVPPFFVVFFV